MGENVSSDNPAVIGSENTNTVGNLETFLKPWETVRKIEPLPPLLSNRPLPSAIAALEALTSSPSYREIGWHGPSIGATVSPEKKDIESLRLFEVQFGRDSLRVALDVFKERPRLLRTTIIRLAQLQGVKENVKSEEEPGRIVHEVRDPLTDPQAAAITASSGWEWPYYGSVDATATFIGAIARYCTESSEKMDFLAQSYTGRDGQSRTVSDALDASVAWVCRRMDSNAEGLIEFKPKFKGSIENQVWKDSYDSYHHADGTLANHGQGIASVEVQALAYDSLLAAAEVYGRMLNTVPADKKTEIREKVSSLQERAAKLRSLVLQRFWVSDKGGYFALGTDRDENGNLRLLKIRTSNMGHLLNSGIMEGNEPETVIKREAVIRQLFSPELLAAGGIRTLASDEIRYKPGAYHNGSVWLWDTYYIAQGLARHGYFGLARELNRRILISVNEFKNFPEFVKGNSGTMPQINTRVVDVWNEQDKRMNRIEQPPQELQAWTVAALFDAKFREGLSRLHPQEATPLSALEPAKRLLEKELLPGLQIPLAA